MPAVAALTVGFLSRRSREPIVSCLLGLGAGVVAGAVYAGAFAGLRVPRASTAPVAEMLTHARAAPPAMHR